MTNWKTTVAGILSGTGYLFFTYVQQGIRPRDAAIAVGVSILGVFAKDWDVTGGTRASEKTLPLAVPPARAEGLVDDDDDLPPLPPVERR